MAFFRKDAAGGKESSPPGGAGRKEKREKRRKGRKEPVKKNIPLRIGVVVLVLALVTATVLAFLHSKPVAPEGTPEIEEQYRTPEYLRDRSMNILVCGIDADSQLEGDDERKVSMTDVIMLVNFDREADKASVLQIPRDTYVGDIVPYGKINGLYQWGKTDVLPEDGEEAIGISPLIQVINEQFGLTVDAYVLITMEGFRNAVDLIGGVDIILEENEEPVDFEGHFVIKPGVNHLNGELAEVFVRYRNYEHADIDRLRMQERFMEALMRKLFELSASELVSTTWKIRDYTVSDLDVAQMLAILKEVRELQMANVSVIRVPGEPVTAYGLYGVSVFSAHKKELADLLNEYMRPYQEEVPESELGIIEIQNTMDDFTDGGSTLG